MGRGRPQKIEITEKLLKQVEDMAAMGLTEEQIGIILGVGKTSVYRYKQKYPLFLEAYKKGRANGASIATGQLMKNIKKGDRASIFFYLKTQWGWRETNRIEHTGKDGEPIQTENKNETKPADPELDLDSLSIEEREQLETLIIKASQNGEEKKG